MKNFSATLFFVAITVCSVLAANPVVIFHGFGDQCSNSGMKKFTATIASGLDGAYVKCVEIGNGADSSILMKFEKQVEHACKSINKDPNFQNKTINVLGLSQGGLIARGIVELCDFGGRVARLISIGGPQMGVATIPKCHKGFICNILNGFVDDFVYTTLVQDTIGPAGYFRNPHRINQYIRRSTFLPLVNNEKKDNELAKARFESLEKVQLTMFSKDSVIDPKETAWFGFYDSDGKTIVSMENQDVFTKDLFGLKTLYDAGKVEFVEINGDHLRFTDADIHTYYIPALQ